MLAPFEILFPIEIASTSTHEFSLEDNVADFPLYDPVVAYYNVSAEETSFKVTRTLTIGNSNNPLYSGNYSKDLIDVTVAASQVCKFSPEHPVLTRPLQYPEKKHTITITNDSSSDVIVYVILTGRIWETLAINPNELPMIR